MKTRILLVDDDNRMRLALSKALARKGYAVHDVSTGDDAVPLLLPEATSPGPFDVCVLDLRMKVGLSGLDVLRQTQNKRIPTIILTGHGTIPDAVEAMRLGAANFVQKPVDADELLPILLQAIQKNQNGEGDDTLGSIDPSADTTNREGGQAPSTNAFRDGDILGDSPAMRRFLEQLSRAAHSDDPVLLLGETGTGKELAARRLHAERTPKSPFVALNAACVPKELFESELFGHKRGAFTGAHEQREGLMARAGDGTLFIDEIGDLPLDAQAKLLRALEERTFRPVGSDLEKPFRAHLCAATHRNLAHMVADGAFRADLYYRLSVVPLYLPPLRARGDDVILLAEAYLRRLGRDRPLRFSTSAIALLRRAHFPGNVRELINLVKRSVIFCRGDVIDADLLEDLLRSSVFQGIPPSPYLENQPVLNHAFSAKENTKDVSKDISKDLSKESKENKDERRDEKSEPSDEHTLHAGARVTLEELEKTHIRRLLDQLGSVSAAARILGVDRRTLQRKMAAWGMRSDQKNDDKLEKNDDKSDEFDDANASQVRWYDR